MEVIESAKRMLEFSSNCRNRGGSVGFVPTMGALHDGHVSLVERASSSCDVVVVSVFVNPTQFNDAEDLKKYPRTFDSDRAMLENSGVDVMFFPSVEEVYPTKEAETKSYGLDELDARMEGLHRPGHFEGVVQVVLRLFDLVNPDKAFFGEKDFQQLTIIKHVAEKEGYVVDIEGCPTVREKDGLAMSSRNVRLSPVARDVAPILHQALTLLKTDYPVLGVSGSLKQAEKLIAEEPAIDLEYLELVDARTLQVADAQTEHVQACVAAWLDGVRLIDNLKVK